MRVRVILQLNPPNPATVAAAATATAPATRSEHRSAKRLPVDYRFSIFSNDASGQRYIPARGINMSRSGALVETEEPVVIGSVVSVKVNKLGLMGSASVRHCTVKGGRFRIGLHFPSPLAQSQ
jgi:hypothetical protein